MCWLYSGYSNNLLLTHKEPQMILINYFGLIKSVKFLYLWWKVMRFESRIGSLSETMSPPGGVVWWLHSEPNFHKSWDVRIKNFIVLFYFNYRNHNSKSNNTLNTQNDLLFVYLKCHRCGLVCMPVGGAKPHTSCIFRLNWTVVWLWDHVGVLVL